MREAEAIRCYDELRGRLARDCTNRVANSWPLWSLVTLLFSYAYVGLLFVGARVVLGTSWPANEMGHAV
jgi:hypothetical protein